MHGEVNPEAAAAGWAPRVRRDATHCPRQLLARDVANQWRQPQVQPPRRTLPGVAHLQHVPRPVAQQQHIADAPSSTTASGVSQWALGTARRRRGRHLSAVAHSCPWARHHALALERNVGGASALTDRWWPYEAVWVRSVVGIAEQHPVESNGNRRHATGAAIVGGRSRV